MQVIQAYESSRNFASDAWHVEHPETVITEESADVLLVLDGKNAENVTLESLFYTATGVKAQAQHLKEGTGPLRHHKGRCFFLATNTRRIRVALVEHEDYRHVWAGGER